MSTDDITTALDAAQAELSATMVPWPDDFMEDLTPHAALLFLRQTSMACAKVCLGAAISLDADKTDSAGVIDEINNGVAACVAGATHALVALEVLPAEAEEGML